MHARRPAFLLLVTLVVASAKMAITDEPDRAAAYDRAMDAHKLHVFLNEGGWCWFQDPRALIHQGKLLVGGVQGNGNGDAVVGVFDLKTQKQLGRTVLHADFKRDDHNAPVFYARTDGRVLAVYALHGNNRTHYYRISESNDLLTWSDEKQFEHNYPGAENVTYMNLYELRSEGKLYNFFRGIAWNPCFITSTDQGSTWGEPTRLVRSELEGRQRPYARYTTNGRDTIYFCFTDAHPHAYGNSVYFAAFRNGSFYRADGSLIKSLHRDGPLKPSEADVVFLGGNGPSRGRLVSAERSAWTSSIALDRAGRPHIAYSLYLTNADHRYRVAMWDGERWIDREVAFGGSCLYERESSYTGLIALDPSDPARMTISTDVDPVSGRSTEGNHEIYRARISPNNTTAKVFWEPVTTNSPVRNLRPAVAVGDGYRVTMWLRGDFVTYTGYQLDVVGLIEKDN